MSNTKPQVVICTPCYGGQVNCHYTESLLHTVMLLRMNGINCYPRFIDYESLIPRGRNTLVAQFLADKENTHLFFVDADIHWNPHDVLKLLKHDKDIIGGIYPQKAYDWSKIGQGDKAKLMMYNLNTKNAKTKIKDGLISVKYIATGFMMIKRQVLLDMIKLYPSLKYKDDINCCNGDKEAEKYLYALFDCNIVNDRYLSEDYLFCERWLKMGNEVFADVSIDLIHIGMHPFVGNFSKLHCS